MKLYGLFLGIFLLILSILFFSWLPKPSFGGLPFMPLWLKHWTDKYGNLRTAVPFIPLSLVIQKASEKNNYFTYYFTLILCLLLASLAELGQLLLPLRSFDVRDIFYAMLGSSSGIVIFYIFSIKKNTNLMIKILDLPFFNGDIATCFLELEKHKGLLTAPSGPGLASIPFERPYYEALHNSDILIPDSGYMAMIWNILAKNKIKRLSGLEFINYFVEVFPKGSYGDLFLVNPSLDEQNTNLKYLQNIGVAIDEKSCYLAPFYGKVVEDDILLEILEKQRPDWILINIGGGTQEILGSYLKNKLSYKPAIICTGAAIAFKTGKQVNIPVWADKLYLGWLFRILSNPKNYYKRYLDAIPLARLLIKYKDSYVPMSN